LPEVLADLCRRNTPASIDLSVGTIDVSKAFGREKAVEVFCFRKGVSQPIGDVFVDAAKTAFRRAALRLLIEQVVKLNLMHNSLSTGVF
jgi:hypothetical protein